MASPKEGANQSTTNDSTSGSEASATTSIAPAHSNENLNMISIFEELKTHIKPISISFISIFLLLFIIIVILVLYISHLKKLNNSRAPTVLESKLLSEVKSRPRESTPMETESKAVDENNDDDAMYDYPEFMPAQLNSDKNSKIVEVMEENELYALSSDVTKRQSMLDGCVYDTIDENLLKQNLLKQKSDLMKETDFSTPRTNSNETNSHVAVTTLTKPEAENSIVEGVDDDLYATIDEAALKLNKQNVNEIPQIRSSVTDGDYACIDESALLRMSSAADTNNIPAPCSQNIDIEDEIVPHCNQFVASHHVNAPKEACNIQPQKVTNHMYTAVDMNAKRARESVMDIGVEGDTKKLNYTVQTGVVCLLENGAVANDLITENSEIGLPLDIKQNAVVKYLEDNRDSMYESIDESALKMELEKLEFIKKTETGDIIPKSNESDKDIENKSQNAENQDCIVAKDDLLLQNGLAVSLLENKTYEATRNNTHEINLMDLHSPIERVESQENIEIADDESKTDLHDTTDDFVTTFL